MHTHLCKHTRDSEGGEAVAFRGYIAINGTEIANSSRVSAHLGKSTPVEDSGVWCSPIYEDPPDSGLYTTGGRIEGDDEMYPTLDDPALDCTLTEVSEGLYEIPDDSVEERTGLWSPPDGARRPPLE